MKKESKAMNRSVVLVLSVMLIGLLIGCGETVAEEPISTSEAESEEVSEEVVSEEVSEPEIVDGVQKVYYDTYDELSLLFETLESPAVVAFDFAKTEEGQVLLYNGAHYSLNEGFATTVKGTNTIKKVTSTAEYVDVVDYDYKDTYEWDIFIETTGTDIEVPLVIIYEDGTEETLTVYITKDWKYSWE